MCLQQLLKNRTARRKDHFVSLDTLIFTGKSHISEVIVILQLLNRCLQKALKTIPFHTQFLICHDCKSIQVGCKPSCQFKLQLFQTSIQKQYLKRQNERIGEPNSDKSESTHLDAFSAPMTSRQTLSGPRGWGHEVILFYVYGDYRALFSHCQDLSNKGHYDFLQDIQPGKI